MSLNKVIFDCESDYQKVSVIDTIFGRTLVTDGKTQSAEKDEKNYHESLVVPAMLKHGNPKRVFIGGGGELATARECLRFDSVEEVVMVDIDEVVVNICKAHLPGWGDGCESDPRLRLIIGDANAEFRNMEGGFDVVVMDISDPIEAGPGIALYTKEFYEFVHSKLNPGGIFVTQSGSADVHHHDDCFTAIFNTLDSVFDCTVPYSTPIPSFGGAWGFNMAFSLKDGESKDDAIKEWKRCTNIDKRISNMTSHDYHFYDGDSHLLMFHLPKNVRAALRKDNRVITEANPVFMY